MARLALCIREVSNPEVDRDNDQAYPKVFCGFTQSLQYLNLGLMYFLYNLHNSTFTYHPTIYGYSPGMYKCRT